MGIAKILLPTLDRIKKIHEFNHIYNCSFILHMNVSFYCLQGTNKIKTVFINLGT